jgi:hypothetical protein
VYTLAGKAEENWAPIIPDCPDYWEMDLLDGKPICKNVHQMGTGGEDVMAFDVAPFTGVEAICNKYKWAKSRNLTWDGITYGRSINPCSSGQEPESY